MNATPRSYLDWNATAPMRPEAVAAMTRALGVAGNPSSIHAEGRAAKAVVERAREQVAALVNAPARLVCFTSGGSEANAFALTPSISLGDGRRTTRLLMSATEHACVREGHRFGEAVETLPVDGDGVVDFDALRGRLTQMGEERVLVSIHLANNETGVIQPIEPIALICREAGALLHVDAVQAAGKIAIDMTTLGADVLTLSAHKLGGPKGVGAVVFGHDRVQMGERLIVGGGQERGLRAGTENVPGIAGFGVAAEAAQAELDSEAIRQSGLRERLEQGVRGRHAATVIFGERASRLPNTSCFAAPGLRAENALILLDLAGVSVSSGSACSSGKVKPSHVLAAMGVAPQLAQGAIRVSMGRETQAADIDAFLAGWSRLLGAASRPVNLAAA